jgi:hypothetical protein
MLHNFSSFGSPTVAFVKGKLSVRGFEGCQVLWSPNMLVCLNCGPSTGSACVKVCYFSYCSQMAEIDTPFQLNAGILSLMFWTGLCIN